MIRDERRPWWIQRCRRIKPFATLYWSNNWKFLIRLHSTRSRRRYELLIGRSTYFMVLTQWPYTSVCLSLSLSTSLLPYATAYTDPRPRWMPLPPNRRRSDGHTDWVFTGQLNNRRPSCPVGWLVGCSDKRHSIVQEAATVSLMPVMQRGHVRYTARERPAAVSCWSTDAVR